jgi:death on curing protein
LAIEKVFYITVSTAIKLHILLMRDWGENRFGIDHKDLLESALNRPKHAENYENSDIIRQSATLCFGLVKNHPWLGGNKRTATFLMEIFLEMNGFELITSDEETYQMVLKVESDTWKVDEIENWLRERLGEM